MAGFLYFIPNKQPTASKLEQLRNLGLGYAFEEHAGVASVLNGPNGQAGVIVADKKTVGEQHRGYFPDRQTWRTIPGNAAGVWIGTERDQLPGPAELARKQQLSGFEVQLADDQSWLIPVARKVVPDDDRLPWYCVLPSSIDLGADGGWHSDKPLQRYTQLWDVACRWWDASVAAEVRDDTATYKFDDMVDAAVLALQANYRICRLEVAMLQLLTIQYTHDVLNVLIDGPSIKEWLKKKAKEENSLSGPDGSN